MTSRTTIAVLLSTAALSLSCQAITLFGLGSGGQLYSFDSATPGAMTAIGSSTAVGIVDIDFRGSNGLLYGIAGSGSTSSINTSTGSLTALFSPASSLGGTVSSFDFNPAADRMRIVVGGTNNFRMVPDGISGATAGTVITDGVFATPSGVTLLDVAYTNPFNGAAGTTLYSIGSDGNLYTHPASGAPQFNTVTSVGALGFIPVGDVSFDISASGTGYLANGMNLYSVNLSTGAATSLGTLGQGLTALAVVPEPSVAVSGGIASLLLLRRSRRSEA